MIIMKKHNYHIIVREKFNKNCIIVECVKWELCLYNMMLLSITHLFPWGGNRNTIFFSLLEKTIIFLIPYEINNTYLNL